MKRITLFILLVLATAAAVPSVARQSDRAAEDRIRRLAAPTPIQQLPVADYRVLLWEMSPGRLWDLKPTTASLILQAGSTIYVREAGSSRWLVGTFAQAPKTIECHRNFRNLGDLVTASTYQALPRPPSPFRIREVAKLPELGVRLASDGRGQTLFLLCLNGNVWAVDIATGGMRPLVLGDSYLRANVGRTSRNCLGIMLDRQNRLWIVANEKIAARPVRNEVTIFRVQLRQGKEGLETAEPKPKPWFQVSYPYGLGVYNHGVNHIATGPDGMIYVSSGSRTDGNEPGTDPQYSQEGETPLTACMWRFDPRKDPPKLETYARGLRNAFGFCWNDRGEMFATESGTNAHTPEELDLIREGRHYGFPFKHADWEKKPYRWTPDPPPGQQFELPIPNIGPDGGGSPNKPLYTFDAHSSPVGVAWLGADFPPPYRGSLLVARFGSLTDGFSRTGFDVLHVTLEPTTKGSYQARSRVFLSQSARPIDLHVAGKGKVYLLEYSRQSRNAGFGEDLPGRILELTSS